MPGKQPPDSPPPLPHKHNPLQMDLDGLEFEVLRDRYRFALQQHTQGRFPETEFLALQTALAARGAKARKRERRKLWILVVISLAVMFLLVMARVNHLIQ